MTTGLQLVSKVTEKNTVELFLVEAEVPTPGPTQVVIRVEATPLNPSDLASLFAQADLSTIRAGGTAERPVITADIPAAVMGIYASRIGKPMPMGIEGAGVVVAAGESPQAQALLGKMVATGGAVGTYSQYHCVEFFQCIPMPDGVTPRQAASAFVNPMTALGFTETMRLEGHKALVNTAAASNLGQMLNRICMADGIGLVNIVRGPTNEGILRELGAKYIVDSLSPTFMDDLAAALSETGATIAFDPIGGGELVDKILTCMEAVFARSMASYDHYGSPVMKQVFIYGSLDTGPTVLTRRYGFTWSVGAWILPNCLQRLGQERVQKMQARVAAEINTTFASHYAREVSLSEALSLDAIEVYSKLVTGKKFLITPQG